MRNAAFLVVIAILAALGGVAGWYWWTAWRFVQSTDDAYVQCRYQHYQPEDRRLYQGGAGPRQPVRSPPATVMFVIDDRDFAAKAAQAEAAVATAEATVETYDNRLDLQRAMIEQAEAAVTAAEVDLERANLDQRYAALASSDFASRQRFETAEADARKAEAALDKARAALSAERNQLAVLQSQKGEEEARLAQARASLVLARNDLDNTVIRAPFAGVVGNRAARVGQYVKPGTQLPSLVPLPQVYVTANFKETQLTQMRPGQPAEVVGRRLSRTSGSPERSRALRRPAARSSACCRRTTRPATSPRSCSACRCASPCRRTRRWRSCCDPASRSPSLSIRAREPPRRHRRRRPPQLGVSNR